MAASGTFRTRRSSSVTFVRREIVAKSRIEPTHDRDSVGAEGISGSTHDGATGKLAGGQFFYSFDLNEVIPPSASSADRRFARSELGAQELAPHYSHTRRPSIAPVLMIRMLLVGYVFAVGSEPSTARYAKLEDGGHAAMAATRRRCA